MDHRVDSALDLVENQRRLVATTKAGSPAHRQASEVLSLIEESHFLLSEIRRLSESPATPMVAAVPAVPTRPAQRVRRRRLPFEVVAVFIAALVTAAAFWELADPAPMNLQASELSIEPAQP